MAVQAVFAHDVGGSTDTGDIQGADMTEPSVLMPELAALLAELLPETADITAKTDKSFFRNLVSGVIENLPALDGIITARLDESWTMERLDKTLKAIARVGIYELQHYEKTSPKIIISEYLAITTAFFDEDSKETGFINAIMDNVESDPEIRFRAQAARGNPQRGLELLDRIDKHFEQE